MPHALLETAVGWEAPKLRTKAPTHRSLALLSPIEEETSVVPEAADVIESRIKLAAGTSYESVRRRSGRQLTSGRHVGIPLDRVAKASFRLVSISSGVEELGNLEEMRSVSA
jgi:hypothetical protein